MIFIKNSNIGEREKTVNLTLYRVIDTLFICVLEVGFAFEIGSHYFTRNI